MTGSQPRPKPKGSIPEQSQYGNFKIDEEYLATTSIVDLYSKVKAAMEDSTDLGSHASLAMELFQAFSGISTEKDIATAAVFLVRAGFLKLLTTIWKNTNGSLGNLSQSYNLLLLTLWSISNCAEEEVSATINAEILPHIIRYLRGTGASDLDEKLDEPWYTTVTSPYISVLGNLANYDNEAALQTMRDMNVKELMVLYKNHPKAGPTVMFKAVILLASLVTESDDNSELELSREDVKLILGFLEDAVSQSKVFPPKNYHRGVQNGFTAYEIIGNLNRIAQPVDKNKKLIVNVGALKYYVNLLEPIKGGQNYDLVMESRTKEVYMACEGLWILAQDKDTAQQIVRTQHCLERLKLHAKSSDPRIRKAAEGALWVLVERDEAVAQAKGKQAGDGLLNGRPTLQADTGKMSANVGHIMVSYNSAARKNAQTIVWRLKEAGFKTWFDQDNMKGSTLAAMSDAIEGAEVVLILFSEKYKNSPNCRSEAEYTFQLGKPFIPIRVQPGYKADGWLGMMIGVSVYLDTNKGDFEKETIPKLLDRIGETMQEQGVSTKEMTLANTESRSQTKTSTTTRQPEPQIRKTTEGVLHGEKKVTSTSASPLTKKQSLPPLPRGSQARQWNQAAVVKWFKEHKLDSCLKSFPGFDGACLLELLCMYERAPDAFYSVLQSRCNLDLLTMMKLTCALKSLENV